MKFVGLGSPCDLCGGYYTPVVIVKLLLISDKELLLCPTCYSVVAARNGIKRGYV
jgi:hypothetical protein